MGIVASISVGKPLFRHSDTAMTLGPASARSHFRVTSLATRTLVVVSFSLAAPPLAIAQTATWSGAVDGNYLNAGNWIGGTPPTSPTQSAIFGNEANTTIFIAAPTIANTWTFDSSYEYRGTAGLSSGGTYTVVADINFVTDTLGGGVSRAVFNSLGQFTGTVALGAQSGFTTFQYVNTTSVVGLGCQTFACRTTINITPLGGTAAHDVTVQRTDSLGNPTVTLATGSGTATLTAFPYILSGADVSVAIISNASGIAPVIFNNLVGTSSVTINGTAGLQLVGTNTYSGATSVNAGTLQLGNGGTTGSIVGNVLNNGTLAFNRSNAYQFDGVISGTGGLQQNGTGRTNLTAINTYTGNTTVNAGTLSVNGSIASSSLLTVNSDGTLGGNGSVGDTTLAGGTLAPGNSIGTMTVAGNLVFGAGSKYAVEVSPDAADRTNVTGTATLSGGTVMVTYLPGTYVPKDYLILSAGGGLAGTKFKGLEGATLPGLTSSLAYDSTNVHLVTAVDRSSLAGLNLNQQAVASTLLDYFGTHGALPAEFAGLDANELTIVSGELAAGAINAGIESADQFLGALDGQAERTAGSGQGSGTAAYAEESKPAGDERFASLGMSASHNAGQVEQVFAKRWNVWGTFYGGSEVIDGDPAVGSHKTTADTWGLVGGVSYRADETLFGIGLGGGASDFSLSDGLGDGNANTFNVGIYGRQDFGNAYVSGALAYGFHDVETDRTVFGEVLSGDFNANSYSGRGEAGYRFDTLLVAISPYAAFQATAYHLPDYTETSNGLGTFALHYDAETTTATRVELGARLEHAMALSDGGLLTLTGRAAWAINGGTDRNVGAAFQSLPGTAFTIDGAEPDSNSALLDAGAEYHAPSGFFAAATFQGEFSGNVLMYAGKLKLGFSW